VTSCRWRTSFLVRSYQSQSSERLRYQVRLDDLRKVTTDAPVLVPSRIVMLVSDSHIVSGQLKNASLAPRLCSLNARRERISK